MDALAASGGGVYLTRSHEGTSQGATFRQLVPKEDEVEFQDPGSEFEIAKAAWLF